VADELGTALKKYIIRADLTMEGKLSICFAHDTALRAGTYQLTVHIQRESVSEHDADASCDATAQTIVPLTDDYDTLRNQLTEVANALDFDTSTATYHDPAYQRYARTFAGTTNRDIKASSLDGDGLASCAAAMGNQSVKDRPRILILATDNQVYDDYHLQIYSLQAAADFATQNNIKLITLFGVDAKNLDPGITQADIDAARTEIRDVTLNHNGLFYEVDDPNATSTIVNEVESTQVKEARENTQVRTTDVPEAWALVLAGAVLALLAVAVWRRA